MKALIPLLTVLCLAAACSEADSYAAENESALEAAWSDVRTYGLEQRAEFDAAVRQRMDVVRASIEELSEQAAAEARTRAEALEANLASLKDATASTWDEARDAFVERVEDLERFVSEQTSS